MNVPPKIIERANVFCHVILNESHREVHMEKLICGLAIVHYVDTEGFLLFGCDQDWNCVTDTWHETLEDAQAQAAAEHPDLIIRWQTA